jgi:hypothetical protein
VLAQAAMHAASWHEEGICLNGTVRQALHPCQPRIQGS